MTPDQIRAALMLEMERGVPIGQAEANVVTDLSKQDYDAWVASPQRQVVMGSPLTEAIQGAGFGLASAAGTPLAAGLQMGIGGLLSKIGVGGTPSRISSTGNSGEPQDIAPNAVHAGSPDEASGLYDQLFQQFRDGGASPEEADFLARQEYAKIFGSGAGGGGSQGFAPQYRTDTLANGDVIFTRNGEIFNTIPAGEWENLTPQQQFDKEQQLQAQSESAAMARENAGNTAANTRAANTEAGINSRFGVTTQEGATMDRAQLAENARQANLSSATNAFGDMTRLAPQLGQLALSNAEFTKDTLGSAPDYLARAFFQQGQTSPLPQVSQADIINQLRSNIGGFNDTIAGFNPQVGSFQQAPAYQPAAPGFTAPPGVAAPPAAAAPVVAPVAAPNPYDAINAIAAQQAGAAANPTGFNAAANARPGVGGFAQGGMTTAPKMIVGDSVSGQPTGHEEMVMNPTGAPIAVQPMNQQGQQAQKAQPAQADPEAKKRQSAHDGIAKVIGFVGDKNLQHALVDEMDKFKEPEIPRYALGTFNPNYGTSNLPPGATGWASTDWRDESPETSLQRATQAGGPGLGANDAAFWQWYGPPPIAATQPATTTGGTGLMGFNIPNLPSPAAANQADISALEKSVRPPAINDLLGGNTPNAPKFGFNLFTPTQLGALTSDDRAALGTTLGTQFNETLQNVEEQSKRRFTGSNKRAANVAGF